MSSGSIIGIIRVNVEPMIGTALVSVVNYHLQGQCWLYVLWRWMMVDVDAGGCGQTRLFLSRNCFLFFAAQNIGIPRKEEFLPDS